MIILYMIITFLLTESIGDAFLSLYNMSLRPEVGLKPDLVLTLAETALHCPSSLHMSGNVLKEQDLDLLSRISLRNTLFQGDFWTLTSLVGCGALYQPWFASA
jgi:hypothetical protein